LLPEFLKPIRNLKAKVPWKTPRGLVQLPAETDITEGWKLDRSVVPSAYFRGGTEEGLKRLKSFINGGLSHYVDNRNQPELDGTSRLSPYLHFGHLGPLTVALAVSKAKAPQAAKDAYLEQLIVRRELAINFVKFNPDYLSFECAPAWAHKTLAQHARDPRKTYSESQLERAQTHDPLWNACQREMVVTGWMHNYMRMYWAKKILEWSKSPMQAYHTAVYLNDKYELDGRDPNGYAGIAWAIVGKHDRPWFERPIFGHIRYMSLESTSKKFDSKRYIRQMEKLAEERSV
jgi:deoxyribodipyrimidine photo-lyase